MKQLVTVRPDQIEADAAHPALVFSEHGAGCRLGSVY